MESNLPPSRCSYENRTKERWQTPTLIQLDFEQAESGVHPALPEGPTFKGTLS